MENIELFGVILFSEDVPVDESFATVLILDSDSEYIFRGL